MSARDEDLKSLLGRASMPQAAERLFCISLLHFCHLCVITDSEEQGTACILYICREVTSVRSSRHLLGVLPEGLLSIAAI